MNNKTSDLLNNALKCDYPNQILMHKNSHYNFNNLPNSQMFKEIFGIKNENCTLKIIKSLGFEQITYNIHLKESRLLNSVKIEITEQSFTFRYLLNNNEIHEIYRVNKNFDFNYINNNILDLKYLENLINIEKITKYINLNDFGRILFYKNKNSLRILTDVEYFINAYKNIIKQHCGEHEILYAAMDNFIIDSLNEKFNTDFYF